MTSAPEICGFFSITGDGEYEDTTSSLRYYIKPQLPFDLNRGMGKLKRKSDAYHERKLNRILTFLVNHKREYLSKSKLAEDDEDRLIPSVQYITSRSILRAIICSSVYPWTILATKYKGNIYLCKYIPKEEIEEEKLDLVSMKYRNYGPMFEHNCLSEHPNKRPDTSEECDSNVQFYCVLKRNLVNRQFLFAGEMDGTDSSTPLDPEKPKEWKPNQFIELKMNIELNTRNRKFRFENEKIHKFWAQSFLSGLERVYIGFRDDYGLVKQIRCFSVRELEQISKRNWKGARSGMEFLDYFLDKVETDMKDMDCPYTTIKYHYDSRLSSTKHEGETEYTFLPEWYLKEMN